MNKHRTILVVDDDGAHRIMLRTLLTGWGYTVQEAADGIEAVEAVRSTPFDMVLMDIRMVRMSGLEALDKIKAINPAIPVMIMTAYASIETAVQALKQGAYDYMTKPLDFDVLRISVERAMEHSQLKEENRLLRESLGNHFDKRQIVGRSISMRQLMDTVCMVAATEATILITGESGTGKEMIAGAIHYNSFRKNGPFVKINCGAITETLLESELFGHEKGAFTGAEKKREGKFRQADGGSIFLDEVSEMSLAMQVKLLRVLQEREIVRVGGQEVIPIDVRVIAATNRDLVREIASGKFREDLYYRLNVVTLHVPPLRERSEDIPLIALEHMKKFAEQNRKDIKGFTPRAMDRLLKYSWPGNVRELINAVERGVILAKSDYIDVDELALILPRETVMPGGLSDTRLKDAQTGTLADVERETILNSLRSTGGNKSEAARRLGITRRTLHKKLKQYGNLFQ
jgi:two-component system response regulator HydG